MKTACGYIRVSTDKQEELSPASQKKLIIEYCKKNDFIISENDFFQDIGISASKHLERPQFNQMIAKCQLSTHPYDAIIVWKFSRFTRNQEESIVYKSMLRKKNVDVISISEPIGDGLGGKLTEAILEIMDEYYSINLGQETMRGMKEAALKGRTTGNAPFGYKLKALTAEEKRSGAPRYEIDEDEAETVKYMFDSFCNGPGYVATLAKDLNSKGIKTHNGKLFITDTVYYILENPIYCGYVRYNYRTNVKKGGIHTRIKPESEWVIVKGNHEPIIDEELFNKAKERLKELRHSANVPSRLPSKHYLSGIMKCKYCGCGMVYNSNSTTNKSPAFRCRGERNGKCTAKQFTVAHKIEDAFFEGFEVSIKNLELSKRTVAVKRPNTEKLNKQIETIERKLKRAKQAYLDGIDSIEEYKQTKTTLEAEIQRLKESMETPVEVDIHEKALNVLEALKDDKVSVQAKNEALKSIIDYISYSKAEQEMEFHFGGVPYKP